MRFSIPNPGGQLKPQMFTDVELKVSLGQKLAVPDDAVIDTGLRKIVYVDKGDGYFEPREVTTGLRAEKLIEILSGLKAGEKIASAANFLIDSEAKLKGIEAKSAAIRRKTGSCTTAWRTPTLKMMGICAFRHRMSMDDSPQRIVCIRFAAISFTWGTSIYIQRMYYDS